MSSVHKIDFKHSLCIRFTSAILAFYMGISSAVIAMAEDNPTISNTQFQGKVDVELTLPIETTTLSNDSINLLQAISEGKPFHNIIDYIAYKNIKQEDIDAIKWSFILSQLAEPLTEGLEDVLSHEIIQKSRDIDLKIADKPEIYDRDYVYDSVNNNDYKIEYDSFDAVCETISQNLRYNKLWDRYGNQYTIKSFFNSETRKENIGYISDYVYTNIGNAKYKDISSLYNNVSILYDIDSTTKTSALVDYWRNPEKLIKEDGSNKLEGQRRYIPVFVGSNITDMYLQLALMCFCKRNSAEGMNYDKFETLYGNCQLWVDSFGNISFYDESTSKFKMVLPNAYNPVFTTTDSNRKTESLYSSRYLEGMVTNQKMPIDCLEYKVNDKYMTSEIDEDPKAKLGNLIGKVDGASGVTYKGWSEKTFIYNKLIGATYSIHRRMSNSEWDSIEYDADSDADINSAYYPAYLGPILDSRIDYRSSLVFSKGVEAYVNPQANAYIDMTRKMGFVQTFFRYVSSWVSKAGYPMMTVPNEEDSEMVCSTYPINTEDSILAGRYYSLAQILLNTLLVDGNTKAVYNSNDRTPEAVEVMYSMAQSCIQALIQTSSDSVLPNTEDSELLAGHDGGGIAMLAYEDSLVDIEDGTLLGSEGGFLKEHRRLYKKEIEEVDHYDPITGAYLYTQYILKNIDDYSTDFWTKRDNRVSNRWENYPSDDLAILSYVWLNELWDKSLFRTFDENGTEYNKIKSFLKKESNTTEDYVSEYNVMPFNVSTASSQTYELTACTIPYEPLNQAQHFYRVANGKEEVGTPIKDLKTGNIISYDPDYTCTNSADICSYALILGLYRNTDTQYNNNEAIEVIDIEQGVDIEELIHKVDFSMTNPVSSLANIASGITQYIHNVFAVGVNTSYTMAMEGSTLSNLLDNYVLVMMVVIAIMIIIMVFAVIFRRRTFNRGIFSVIALGAMMVSVPVVFFTTQNINNNILNFMSQSTVDKTTLVVVQQAITELSNTEAVASVRWKVFREQFTENGEVFEDWYIYVPVGYNESGVEYEKRGLEDLVQDIKYKGALESKGLDTVWYTLPFSDELYPLSDRYDTDVTKYFYDNLMKCYMEYYDGKTSSDQATIINQYRDITNDATERTKVTDNLDGILHQLKGGYSPILYDTEYLKEKDLMGVARFFNDSVVQKQSLGTENEDSVEVKIENVKRYTPMIETEMKSNKNLKPYAVKDVGFIVPYTTSGLKIQTDGERTRFLWDYSDIKQFDTPPTKFEDKIQLIRNNSEKRIKRLLKYRTGEFSDTALMYTSAMIITEEVYDVLADLKYGTPDVTDVDKTLRLIYCTNLDDIYNTEALMYVVSDSVKGGGFLTFFVLAVEVMLGLVNICAIGICIIVALFMPILIYIYFDGYNRLWVQQLVGVLGQLVLSYLSVFVIHVPLIVGVYYANKVRTSFYLWIYTLIFCIVSYFCCRLSVKLLFMLSRDWVTAGGSAMMKAIGTIAANFGMAHMLGEFADMELGDANMNTTGGTFSIQEATNRSEAQEIELRSEESQGTLMSTEEVDKEYMKLSETDSEQEPEPEPEEKNEQLSKLERLKDRLKGD